MFSLAKISHLPASFLVCLIGFLFLSLLGNGFYLKVPFNFQPQSLVIEEINHQGYWTNVLKENPLRNKTALAYTEATAVDGQEIDNLDESGAVSEDFSGYFLVTNNDSLNSLNSPEFNLEPGFNRSQLMTYIVKAGDTPAKIALNFGISLETLLWANNLKSGSLIQPGQELIILPVSGARHQIKNGETISSIAKLYNVSPEKILTFNHIMDETNLKPGEYLIVPGARLIQKQETSGQKITAQTLPDLGNYFIYPTTGWNWGKLHYYNAVDIANSCGTPIYAAASGMVIEAQEGWNSGYGNFIKLQHPNGVVTVYAHLSDIRVAIGQNVSQGALIGLMGNTGKTNGPSGCHLHFEVRGAKNPLVK